MRLAAFALRFPPLALLAFGAGTSPGAPALLAWRL
jgi:hypothetical protein